jgi:tRNA(Glu) U13 pseudouridine synthase TruD
MIKTSRKFHCLFNGTKTSSVTVEEILKQLAKVVDGLTGIFGRTRFGAQIENRVGSLLLSSHFLTSRKVVKMSGTKLANNQRLELIQNVVGQISFY